MNQFWENKRVFITGADGFIGSWLTKALLGLGAGVIALIRDFNPESSNLSKEELSRIQIIHGRLEDYSTLERAINEHHVDTVFHLAAQALVGPALRSPLQTFESNIRGTYNLLEVCRQHKSHIEMVLVASSDKAYGTSPILPYTEEMPLSGVFPYEVSKSCADLLSISYAQTYDLPIVIARCGNVYGGGDKNWSRIIPGTIRSLLNEEAPIIRSDGKLMRDYVFVEDAVQAYLLMAMHAQKPHVRGEAFNFGPESPLSALEIVQTLQSVMNRTHLKPIILNQSDGEIPKQYLNSEKAKDALGWIPKYSLEEGLRSTVTWYENYLLEPTYV